MRRILFTVAVVAAAAPAAYPRDPVADGNWVLSTVGPLGESAVLVLKVERKGGVPAASVASVPQRGPAAPPKAEVHDFKVTDAGVSFTVRQFGTDQAFVGAAGKDAAAPLLGSFGPDQRPQRAKLTATAKDSLTAAEAFVRVPVEPFTKAQQAQTRPLVLLSQAQQEKDADKKKELLAQAAAARKAAEESGPGYYREVVAGHADTPAAYDAAFALLRAGAKANVTAGEATKLVSVVETQAAAYGPRFARVTLAQAADALARHKELAPVAREVAGRAAKALTPADPAAFQVEVLTAYKAALENTPGEASSSELAGVGARLAKLDAALDQEYLAAVPPFKPEPAAGRREKGANRVAVLELFTGAQCPPCVAADVAFDALEKTYRPADLILVQYHLHIPGPDPLTNPDAVARWNYYRGKFAADVRGTPTTVFNGRPAAGGGGSMAGAEAKYKQYRGVIDPILEAATPVAVTGTAARRGDRVEVAVEVTGAGEQDELKLRFVLVEETVKYVGGNKLRFHHQVVRATPGGAAGVAVKAASSRHTTAVDLAALKQDLTRYLDGYAADERPFPSPHRPLDLKNLRVIALVQNDATGEIVQAARFDVGEGSAAAR
jgi:hypothetical protein